MRLVHDRLDQREPVHARQVRVHERHGERLAARRGPPQQLQGALPALRHRQDQAPLARHLAQRLALGGAVVDHQQPPAAQHAWDAARGREVGARGGSGRRGSAADPRRVGGRRCAGRPRRLEARGEMERAALARVALHPQPPAHHRHELGADREAQPGPAVVSRRRAVRLREGLEDHTLELLRYPDPGVAHLHAQDALTRPCRLDVRPHHHLASLRELDGVADQVEEQLPQPSRIADQPLRHRAADRQRQLQSLLMGARAQRAHSVPDRAARIERHALERQLAGLDLREVEDVVDQSQQRARRVARRRQVLALLAREPGVERELGHAEDRVHRRADLVAHVREELALGATRRLRRLLRLRQLGGRCDALGDVARGREDHAPMSCRRCAPREPTIAPVAALVAVLEVHRLHAGREATGLGDGRRAIVGVHEVEVRTRDELLARPAQHVLPGRVQPFEVPVVCGDAQHVAREREELLQLLLLAPALDEAADLLADARHDADQVIVGLADLAREELEDRHHFAANEERNAERAVEPFLGGHGSAREVHVGDHVRHPHRPSALPHAARKPHAGG